MTTRQSDGSPHPSHGPVRYERRGRVGLILVDHPPVNALSQPVREGLLTALDQGLADPQVTALVLAGDGRTFIAGADIAEFGQPPAGPDITEINARLEASPKPVIAAIHGTAFGGGLEVALACHYRVATTTAQVGLPEVKLGLLPGGGGTQRLTRLVGPLQALSIIAGGAPLAAGPAQSLGILDRVAAGDVIAQALAFAEALPPGPHPVLSQKPVPCTPEDRQTLAHEAHKLSKAQRGQTAPQRCAKAVEAACTLPFAEGLERERALFIDALHDPQSRALIRLFFAERTAAKAVPAATLAAARLPARVAVIGSGTMGGGIAMSFANAGLPVTLLDVNAEALERGLGTVRANYAGSVAKGRLSAEEMAARLERITPTTRYDDLADADLIVEAAPEDMTLKQRIFRQLDQVAKPGAVLATNTSTLDIDALAAVTSRAPQVIGVHFFSPAHVMRLIEIVVGAATTPDTVAVALATARRLGKLGVVVGNCDGFVGNRMVGPYGLAAHRLVEDGALPEQVDRAMAGFGMAMGPFVMSDLAGNDVGWLVRQRRLAEGKQAMSAMIDWLYANGRWGMKAGKGWFTYAPGSRTPEPDADVTAMIDNHRRTIDRPPCVIDDAEIVSRCVLALVNEGANILDEGIARTAGDIDLIYVNGYGFPAWRGGPMGYAQEIGLAAVLEKVRDYHRRYGAEWTPSPLLERLVAAGKTRWDEA